MYFYFFCEYPAVIKFQGVIFGTIDNSVKFCNLSEPYPFTEICPLAGGDNFNFYPDASFLNSPPQNVSITDLKGGYFIRFSKTENSSEFKILEQAKFRDATITAFTDNGCKVSLETKTGFFAETLPFSPVGAEFTRGEGVNSDLIFALFLSSDKKVLNVYDVKELSLLMSKQIDGFEISPSGFTTTENFKDIAKHTLVCGYQCDNGILKEISRTVSSSENFDRDNLPDRLIPYAFIEEFWCGGDYAFYLAENVKENSDKLKGYLGDFLGITPPPVFRNYKEIGLIRKIAERKYSVDYYIFDVDDGKITNIKKL